MVGCYGRESELGEDKVYSGGRAGASLMGALQFAARKEKRYVAVARSTSVDGHAFAFSSPPKGNGMEEVDDGCEVPCNDAETHACGCADEMCISAGSDRIAGEDNTRRWVVYELQPEVAQMLRSQRKARSGKKKGSSKKRSAPKSEL